MTNEEHTAALIRGLMAAQGLSQRELARRAGLSLSIVSAIVQGRYPPGTAIGSFEKLAAALGVGVGELFGEVGATRASPALDESARFSGDARVAPTGGEATTLHRIEGKLDRVIDHLGDPSSRPHLEVLGTSADTLLVPLYGHAAAGLGAYNEPIPSWASVDKIPVPRSLRPSDGQLTATLVRGESMEPELSAGDIVVLHYPERQPALRLLSEGALVAVTVVDGGEWNDYLKRYSIDPRTGAELLVSTNAAYRPIPLHTREVRFIGAVKMVLKKG